MNCLQGRLNTIILRQSVKSSRARSWVACKTSTGGAWLDVRVPRMKIRSRNVESTALDFVSSTLPQIIAARGWQHGRRWRRGCGSLQNTVEAHNNNNWSELHEGTTHRWVSKEKGLASQRSRVERWRGNRCRGPRLGQPCWCVGRFHPRRDEGDGFQGLLLSRDHERQSKCRKQSQSRGHHHLSILN